MPTVTSNNAKFVLYTNDTSIIITSPSSVEFSNKVNTVFVDINEWFRSNLFSLNFDITHFLQFLAKNSQELDLNITKHITNTTNIKFPGLTIDETLSWKFHIDHILVKAEHYMLCCYGGHTTYSGRNFKIDLFFICSLNNTLWVNFWGEFTAQ